MIKLIIAGGRDFDNYQLLKEKFIKFIVNHKISPYANHKELTIISGMARGADRLGVDLANLYNIPLIKMPADWDKYGKSAGYKRNKEMAKIATHALVAWDGKSKGTGHMLNLIYQYGLIIKIINY